MLQPVIPARVLLLLLAVTSAEAQPRAARDRQVTVATSASAPLPEVWVAAGYMTVIVLDAHVDKDSVQLDIPPDEPRIRLVDVGANSFIRSRGSTPLRSRPPRSIRRAS